MAHYRKALELKPDYAEAHNNLGNALVSRGQTDEAMAHYRKALELKPDCAEAHNNLDLARSQWEGILKVLAARRELLRSRPDDVALLNDIAWILATNPNTSIRHGAEAVALAQRAVRLSQGQEPALLGTLAAAYAEAGRFPEAAQTARMAQELATQQNNQSLAESVGAKIILYQAGTPFREIRAPSRPDSARP
jgi:Flp pilus assembly protein TadD